MAFTPKITFAGEAAAVSAAALGLSLQITHVALGAGSYNPTGSETALADRRETAAVASGSDTAGNVVTINTIIHSTGYAGAPYAIGEIGFFAGNPASGGTLFAVASVAGDNFGHRGSNVADFIATYVLTLSGVPAGSVTVLIDPDAGASFKLLSDHTAQANPHPQYMLPPGAVLPFASTSAPTGWLVANGQAVSRTTYASLFSAIGTLYNNGTAGATQFNLPDLRGEFLRGADMGRGIDAGRTIGSAQADELKSHSHNLADVGLVDGGGFSNNRLTSIAGATTGTTSTGGSETRPRNIAMVYCIKH